MHITHDREHPTTLPARWDISVGPDYWVTRLAPTRLDPAVLAEALREAALGLPSTADVYPYTVTAHPGHLRVAQGLASGVYVWCCVIPLGDVAALIEALEACP